MVLLEGWCVGARPQGAAALVAPVNEREAAADPDGRWRAAVDAALAGEYRRLFAAVDMLVLLRASSFEVVYSWRAEAERNVRAMDAAALRRFVQHFERLTRHVDAEMPARADLVFALDAERRPLP